MRHGDEISLGNRFTSQEKPELVAFLGLWPYFLASPHPSLFTFIIVTIFSSSSLDWVFLGTAKSSPLSPDIDKIKGAKSFDDLLEMGDTDLINMGVRNQEVRYKVLGAIKTWNEEHVLPGLLLLSVSSFLFHRSCLPSPSVQIYDRGR